MRQQQDQREAAAVAEACERVEVHPAIARAIEAGVKAGACWHAMRVGYRPDAPWRQIGAAQSHAVRQALAGTRPI